MIAKAVKRLDIRVLWKECYDNNHKVFLHCKIYRDDPTKQYPTRKDRKRPYPTKRYPTTSAPLLIAMVSISNLGDRFLDELIPN